MLGFCSVSNASACAFQSFSSIGSLAGWLADAARAYSPDVMKPHVPALSTALMVTALFDREVNCRRAAAAAFQENVGRQGVYPHGIEIIQSVNYFTLANRTHTYTDLAV